MDLNAIWMFLKVAQTGSFTRAAKELGIPKSTVSKKIADLESSLQSTLLLRTTRSLQLTDAGKRYYDTCAKAFEDIKDAEAFTQAASSEPAGNIRVTATAEFARKVLSEIMQGFLTAYPNISVDLILTNQALDFVRDNIDVAVRAGQLKDSNLKARRVGATRFQLLASPSYLKAAPELNKPSDLSKHNCLVFTSLPNPSVWLLRSGSQSAKVKVQGRYMANSINAIKSMAASGAGIALLPTVFCKEEIARKELGIVLPNWASGEQALNLVYQNSPFIAPRVTAFLNYMQEELRVLLK
ncbi:LysR family transcriptional regulator [Sapientia aquatica]|uniref:LysR family transcriptional regulator n=1 Tax=Sapientia aquatica TaxID=1549640 RepID=A0A4R5VWD7_9BURK|nr:LysR family transcriptional regulator [Sapientia aquatica]TDK63485.1 LysR family transcriptional regulator [Sapientia aquatica]